MTSDPYPDSERLALVEDVRSALAEVYSGADTNDAEAVLDQLDDRGRVVR